MLGDTLTLPQSGGDIVLKKVNQDGYSSEYRYRSSTTEYRAFIRHTVNKGKGLRPDYDRHNFEVVQTVFATTDALEIQRKFYFVLECEKSDTNVILADAVCDLAIAGSNALLVSLLGWES